MAARPPLVVEVIGPAGAGKTTLVRALRERHERIEPDIDIRLSRISKIPFVIGNTLFLLPTYLRRYRHSRWFSWRETRGMAYLKAGLHLLGQQTPKNGSVTILDHGPIYRLAFLREFGPEITTSRPYKRWWANLLRQWTARIDVVISLDAPNVVLLERIRARDSWHTTKEKCDEEAFEILCRYRTACEQTIAESVTERRLTLLRFDTSQQSTEQIVERVLATFDSARHAGQSSAQADLIRRVMQAKAVRKRKRREETHSK
jgi:broad-specificity NMP kinase